MNPFHQTVAQHTKHQNFCQIVCGNGDIRDLTRNLCALADGDSNVCGRKAAEASPALGAAAG